MKFEKFFKNTFFYRIPPEGASEERIAEGVRNFPCLYDKGNRATKKEIGKRTHDLGCRMPALRRNYKGNLDSLKRYSEKFL